MQYTTIPGTDMQASRICLGTMTFGSPVAGPDAVRLVRYALEEHGVNFIDTANMYEGYNRYAGSAGGVAEEIVGEAVAHRRGDYILATKVGMKVGEAPEDENTSPEAIRIQLRRSLVRMRTDYVDVYYLHRYDPDTEPHAVARAMGEELRAGTIRAWGVSNYTAAQLAALLAAAADEGVPAPALCQPALSMLNTSALEELLPLCEKEGGQTQHDGFRQDRPYRNKPRSGATDFCRSHVSGLLDRHGAVRQLFDGLDKRCICR